jgi:hypothetical protein
MVSYYSKAIFNYQTINSKEEEEYVQWYLLNSKKNKKKIHFLFFCFFIKKIFFSLIKNILDVLLVEYIFFNNGKKK